MAQSNYDITLSRMPGEFLKYNQQRMIRMFCREHDAQYLYLRLLDRRYRVSRAAGTIEWEDEGVWQHAGFLDAMTIYDLLCCAKDSASLCGRYSQAKSARHDPRSEPRKGRVRRLCRRLRPQAGGAARGMSGIGRARDSHG